MRRYPTNREFIKTIRHNGKDYTLRSIFDDIDKPHDFDKSINMRIGVSNYGFDDSIDIFNSYKLYDSIDDQPYTNDFVM